MEFSRVMRGYDIEEVDKAVDKLEAQNRRLAESERELEERIERLNKEIAGYSKQLDSYRDSDRNLRDAFAGIQRIEAQIRGDAERDVEVILEKARNESREMVENARLQAEEVERQSEELLLRTTGKTNEEIERAQNEANEIIETARLKATETLEQSSDLMMSTTVEVNDMMKKTQERILEIEIESEKGLEINRAKAQENLKAIESESELKSESLEKLTALEALYIGRLGELRSHVQAIEMLFNYNSCDKGNTD